MKLELINGIVETLFDYAFVVYTGPDDGRWESAINGRPYMPKGTPVMIEKKSLGKVLRTGMYAEWGSVPGQVEMFEPSPESEQEEGPLEAQFVDPVLDREPESLEEALTGVPASASASPRFKKNRRKKLSL